MADLLESITTEFQPKFDALNKRAEDLAERLESARDSEDTDGVKALTESHAKLEEEVKSLLKERDTRVKDAELESTKSQVAELRKSLEASRQIDSEFFGSKQGSSGGSGAEYEDRSFFVDAYKALAKGDNEAMERWAGEMGTKAMTIGTGSAGGFLVPDQISDELIALRVEQTVLRALIPVLQVNSDTLRISKVDSGLTADWVAELAAKPQQDAVFSEITENVFTKAGLAVVSNQLLRDSSGNKAIDTFIAQDLAKRLAIVEEKAILNGTGTGQPQGILNTTGVDNIPLTSTAVLDLLDAIADGISQVVTEYFGDATAVVMHPRTWTRIVKARESGTSANYILGPPSNLTPRRAEHPLPGMNAAPPRGEIFGVPVYTTSNVPTNLGAGTNESAVIVGAFNEGLILENHGVVLDVSEHVHFTTNQTVFRAEDRVGFSAKRYPVAFKKITGVGLASG